LLIGLDFGALPQRVEEVLPGRLGFVVPRASVELRGVAAERPPLLQLSAGESRRALARLEWVGVVTGVGEAHRVLRMSMGRDGR